MAPTLPWHLPDTGSVVVGWLTRLVMTFAILGLIGFEVLSVAVTHVQIQDIGQSAAQKAIDTFQQNQNPSLAYQAAETYAVSQGSEINQKSFVITPQSVTFDLEKTAPTLLLYRWSRSAKWAQVETTVYAEPFETSGQSP